MNCCPKPPGPRRAARGGLGAVAQLEERFHGMEEVRSSSLRSSTPVSPGAMAQLVARLVRNEKAGSSSLPSSTEPSGPSRRVGKHEQFVTGLAGSGQCGTCRDRRHAGRLKRLVELQAKVPPPSPGKSNFLHGGMGISFRAIGHVRGIPEWWVAREYRQRRQKQEQVNGM